MAAGFAAVAFGAPLAAAAQAPLAPIDAAATTAAALTHAEAEAARGDFHAQEAAGLLHLVVALDGSAGRDAHVGRAVEWLTRAAEQGSGLARALLASLYADGRLVPRDELAARRWRSAGTLDDAGCR